jgi:hypothetical protein
MRTECSLSDSVSSYLTAGGGSDFCGVRGIKTFARRDLERRLQAGRRWRGGPSGGWRGGGQPPPSRFRTMSRAAGPRPTTTRLLLAREPPLQPQAVGGLDEAAARRGSCRPNLSAPASGPATPSTAGGVQNEAGGGKTFKYSKWGRPSAASSDRAASARCWREFSRTRLRAS